MPPELSRKLGVEASFRIPLFPSLTSVQRYLYFHSFFPLRLALLMMKRERVKLVKLANFQPAKTPVKKELGQLDQLFFESFKRGDLWSRDPAKEGQPRDLSNSSIVKFQRCIPSESPSGCTTQDSLQ